MFVFKAAKIQSHSSFKHLWTSITKCKSQSLKPKVETCQDKIQFLSSVGGHLRKDEGINGIVALQVGCRVCREVESCDDCNHLQVTLDS